MNGRMNMIVFNIFWLVVVTLAAENIRLLEWVLFFVYFIIFRNDYIKNRKIITAIFVIGVLFDFICASIKYVEFMPNNIFLPSWLIVLWLLFSQVALKMSKQIKSKLVIILLFTIGGPTSYYYGTTVGLIKINSQIWWFIQIFFWIVLAYLILKLNRNSRHKYELN